VLLTDPPAPLLKWPGGKRAELSALAELLPRAARYHEPFVGGGAVWFATDPEVPAVVNDACPDLVALYRAARDQSDDLNASLAAWVAWWTALDGAADALSGLADAAGSGEALSWVIVAAVTNQAIDAMPVALGGLVDIVAVDVPARLSDKARRIGAGQRRRGAKLSPADVAANLEAALRSVVYRLLRRVYNEARLGGDVRPFAAGRRRATARDIDRVAAFWLLRELAYAAMFRFNGRGEFNVPYGGISYNRRDLSVLPARLADPAVRSRLATTRLCLGDFASALAAHPPGPDDVVFVDPPYAAEFSTYDDQAFTDRDHRRLASALQALPCRFVLVVSDAGATAQRYGHDGWEVHAIDKTWAWTIKQRNDRRARLLVVTNDPDRAAA